MSRGLGLRRIWWQTAALVVIGGVQAALPSEARAVSSAFTHCGRCQESCGHWSTWDEICHTICSAQSLGWCPTPNELCSFWTVYLHCQGGAGS